MGHTNDDDWGITLNKIDAIALLLRSSGQLGDALRELRGVMQGYLHPALQNRLEALQNDYELMCQYFAQGYQDAQREQLYDALTARMHALLSDCHAAYYQAHSPLARPHMKWRETLDFLPEAVRGRLEAYVTDVAMCSLEPDTTRDQRLRALHMAHYRYMQQLADAVLFSFRWNAAIGKSMAQIICSPTIDIADAQLLTTAIMLSAMTSDDPERFKALVTIYEQATDDHLRQRALVGWALSISDRMAVDHPDTAQQLNRMLAQTNVRQEVMEMQQQIIFCRNAKKDNERLKQDIMPGLLKNSDFKISSMGITPKEEDSIDDILNPENADRRMEEMEESIRRMAEMRKQGADIYFGGFSQMKRFSFFYTLINWFLPFLPHHPGLQHLSKELLESGLADMLTHGSIFCESDKYSFVLGLSSIFHQLPPQLREALKGEPGIIPLGTDAEVENTPSFLRRMYLQDLYRFFSLCDERKLFVNPFDDENFLFITQGVYVPHMRQEARRVERLLYKRKQYTDAFAVLAAYQEEDNVDDLTLQALLCVRLHRYEEAATAYTRLHELEPENIKHVVGAAQAELHQGRYEEAASWYGMVYQLEPDRQGTLLNYAIALICSDRAEEGVRHLYKLFYDRPDDVSVKRALAFGLLYTGRLEQAGKLYDELLEAHSPNAADYVNAAYAKWVSGDIKLAVLRLAKGVTLAEEPVKCADAIAELMAKDCELLGKYNIHRVEMNLMADLCFAQLGKGGGEDR